ncbi:hypothetical protein [Kordiimonas sp.]|uniref:hypothetical protein n=1 Tax=Kordiimonas sp. TaxID=1970157 RepID=UPI003A8E4DD2
MKSRQLDPWRYSEAQEVHQAVTAFISQMDHDNPRQRQRRPIDEHRQRITAQVVLLDLFALYNTCPSAHLSVSLTKDTYSTAGRNRYMNPQITIRLLRRTIGFMRDKGWIEVKPGFYCRYLCSGKQTRIRARRPLLRHLAEHGVKLEHITNHPNAECITLKAPKNHRGHKMPIQYEDNATTIAHRQNLRELNRFTTGHQVALPINLDTRQAMIPSLPNENDEEDKLPIDFTKASMTRIFNNSDWQQGGRFYGPWWQRIPSQYRSLITINGHATTERDYSGMHLRLLYHQEGLPIPEHWDPYDIPALPGMRRELIKKATNMMLNGKDPKRMSFPEGTACPFTFMETVEAIQKHHRPIASHFLTGVGLFLQRKDSDIAEEVMLTLMDDDILALCIHDSFIVALPYEQRLLEVMSAAYSKATGHLPLIK